MTLPDFTEKFCDRFDVSGTLPLAAKEFAALAGARKSRVGYCWEIKQSRDWVHFTVVLTREGKDQATFLFSLGTVEADEKDHKEQRPAALEKLFKRILSLGREATFDIMATFTFPLNKYKAAIELPTVAKIPATGANVEARIFGVRVVYSGLPLKWVIVDVDEEEGEIQVTVNSSTKIAMSEQFLTRAFEQVSAIGGLFVNEKTQ